MTASPHAGAYPTAPPPAAAAADSPVRPPRSGGGGRLRARWSAVPLLARLVGIITVLVAVGLVLAGVTSTTLLKSTLISQVDSKLTSEGQGLARSTVETLAGWRQADQLPSDYYVRIQVLGQSPSALFSTNTVTRYGAPLVPELSPREANELDGPFTVRSSRVGSPWRVVAYPFTTQSVVGAIVVALPLGDIERGVRQLTLVLVLSGIGIVLLGAAVGTWAVRRSLRPLREIESTAAAIAHGDLSRRVPTAPESTEVGRLGAALNGMLAQIEQAFAGRTASEARMRRFVADASHELRTPLATIRGYGELYRMGALTTKEEVDDTMRRIEGSATRMGTLVEDLLALARLDENRPLSTAPVDLTVLAADAVSDVHALDPTRRARLEPLAPGGTVGPCVVLGEEGRIRQVLANLVGNVVQHTPAGSPVEIAVGQHDRYGVVEVRDHGPGIEPEHAARVFERFYRVDASRGRQTGGAGLGMAIVAAIVHAHDGTVELSQTPGGGTTVRVAFPLAPTPGSSHGGTMDGSGSRRP